MFKIPKKTQYVIETLQSENYEAYIVGGCVRDMLLGKTPNDFDLTTSALPEEVMELFPKTVPTGIKHGTVTVIVDREPIEVTTFREEEGYSDNRRPDSVNFVRSLEKDLMRRDFTVNAMAYNDQKGLCDFYGGKQDLENKILRAVGSPAERFSEDALRILRLFRFSSQLDFSIEPKTKKAALQLQSGLKNISAERIFTELYKTASGINPSAVAPLIENGGLEFLGITKIPDFELMKSCRDNSELSFYLFLSPNDCMEETLAKLKVSNSLKSYCKGISELKSYTFSVKKSHIKEMLNLSGEALFRDFLRVSGLSDEDIKKCQQMLSEIKENNEPYRIAHLDINGKTLKRLGFSGEEIGFALERARKYIVENPEYNIKSHLVDFLTNNSP